MSRFSAYNSVADVCIMPTFSEDVIQATNTISLSRRDSRFTAYIPLADIVPTYLEAVIQALYHGSLSRCIAYIPLADIVPTYSEAVIQALYHGSLSRFTAHLFTGWNTVQIPINPRKLFIFLCLHPCGWRTVPTHSQVAPQDPPPPP
jgi:hypothetical protein